MNASEERENEMLRRVLEKRFEHLERQVPDEVSNSIWRQLGRERYRTGGLIAALALVLLGLTLYLAINKPEAMSKIAGKPAPSRQDGRRVGYATSAAPEPKQRGTNLSPLPGKIGPSINTKQNNVISKKADTPKVSAAKSNEQPGITKPKSAFPSKKVNMVRGNTAISVSDHALSQPGLFQPKHIPAFPDAQDVNKPVGDINANLNNPKTPGQIIPIAFQAAEPAMVQPEISVKPDSALKTTATKRSKRVSWLISATPLQTFQTLRLNSTPEVVYQNIRFPGIGSSESKGLKFAAGLERSGWQLVGSYAYLSYYTQYEIGTDEFELSPTPTDPYRLVRKGESRELHDEFHVLGLALRRSFGDHKPLPLQIRGFAGVEYARTIRGGINTLNIQAGLLKSWLALPSYEVSAGPFAEVGLLNRTALAGAWRYRPYQIGVTVQLRKKGGH